MTKPTVASALLCVLSLGGCHAPEASMPEQPPVAAQVLTISAANSDLQVGVAGVVKPRLEADLAAQIIAPIASITKHEGDRVGRGEVLVRLHAPALQAGVDQASAALASAEHQQAAAATQAKLAADTLARYQQLRARHSVTPYELDQMQAQNASAQAQQQSAAAQIGVAQSALAAQRASAADTVLYAPFDGVITRRLADPGAMATPGVPLLHLQSLGEQEVDFTIPADLLGALHLGSSLSVTESDGGSPVQATVMTISPGGDAASHSFLVKASLPKASTWNAGTFVNVMLPVSRTHATITIPMTAVAEQGGLDAVLVLDSENRAQVRYVTLGVKSGTTVEVLSGLRSGERILVHGDLSAAGRKVEVHP